MEFYRGLTRVCTLEQDGVANSEIVYSREVVVHIADFTVKKYLKKIKSSSCCKMHITGSIDIENPDHEYLIILNRGGLTIPSPNLVNYVRGVFAVLSATENVLINQSISHNYLTDPHPLSPIKLSKIWRKCHIAT